MGHRQNAPKQIEVAAEFCLVASVNGARGALSSRTDRSRSTIESADLLDIVVS